MRPTDAGNWKMAEELSLASQIAQQDEEHMANKFYQHLIMSGRFPNMVDFILAHGCRKMSFVGTKTA